MLDASFTMGKSQEAEASGVLLLRWITQNVTIYLSQETNFFSMRAWMIVSSHPPHVELLCHLFSLRLLWHLDTKSREYEGIVSVVCKYEICRSLRAIISENCCINVVKGEVGYLV